MSCAACGLPSSLSCSACSGPKYCSKRCQKSDWKKHKLMCGTCPKCEKAVVLCTCSEEPLCYICMERHGTLLQPCLCTSFVHRDCVIRFAITNNKQVCMLCHHYFPHDISYEIAEMQLTAAREGDDRAQLLNAMLFRAKAIAWTNIAQGIEEYVNISRQLNKWKASPDALAVNHMMITDLVTLIPDKRCLNEAHGVAFASLKTMEFHKPNSAGLANTYRIYAQLQAEREEFLDALSYYCKARHIFKKVDLRAVDTNLRHDIQHWTAGSLIGIGRTLILIQRFGQAREPLQEAYDLLVNFAGRTHPATRNTQDLLMHIIEYEAADAEVRRTQTDLEDAKAAIDCTCPRCSDPAALSLDSH